MAAASTLLKDSIRWADNVGRSGDGEFLLILPETTAVAALKLAQKKLAAVSMNTTRSPTMPRWRFSLVLSNGCAATMNRCFLDMPT
jgi:GGDEF domain-containing protein